MAAARRSKPRARTRARRSSSAMPVLEQRHLDLLGLGLVALAVFLAFVLYGGHGAAGGAGNAPLDGLGWGVRGGGYPPPPALAPAGGGLLPRPPLPPARPP